MNLTPSTLARRKRNGVLSSEESDRLYRIAFLIERATQVLGTLEAAQRWLNTEKRALSGATPLVFAKTEPGAREVEDLLGRIEYGIPS
jgi:putative toxin-antitoxin system antitoxin component (TIGR02293 family)